MHLRNLWNFTIGYPLTNKFLKTPASNGISRKLDWYSVLSHSYDTDSWWNYLPLDACYRPAHQASVIKLRWCWPQALLTLYSAWHVSYINEVSKSRIYDVLQTSEIILFFVFIIDVMVLEVSYSLKWNFILVLSKSGHRWHSHCQCTELHPLGMLWSYNFGFEFQIRAHDDNWFFSSKPMWVSPKL